MYIKVLAFSLTIIILVKDIQEISSLFSAKTMSVLEKLEENKPYLGFKKLSVGFHQIKLFRSVKNKFEKKEENGDEPKSILVELDDQVIFLPQYFKDKISDSEMCELNSDIENKKEIYLHFGGKNETSK